MIEAQELTRRYGDFTAVEGISFAVPDGEILGILGPNGAGKTTTIRMITGFLPPSSGRVIVAGQDLLAAPLAARRHLGYLPESVALYPEMRVNEYLAYRAQLEGMRRPDARQAIGEALERCLLQDVSAQIIGTLSKGYRQRVGLAAAILHRPRVLVLDEPTVGLDPKQIIAIRELIRELGRERTLLLSTHILPEVEQLCNRVLIIDRGRIVASGTPAELREQSQGQAVVRVTLKGAPSEAPAVLAELPGVESVRPGASHVPGQLLISAASAGKDAAGGGAAGGGAAGGGAAGESAAGEDLRETVFRMAVERGWVLLELAEEKASLEDIFVRLTTQDMPTSASSGEAAETAAATAAEGGTTP